jgi:hypothetical protein
MKKTKPQIEDLETDDEALRERGLTAGPAAASKWTLRPVTALTVSWMQRNAVFGEHRDMIWKAAAFGFLHSAPPARIRSVVNDPAAFTSAVDTWIEESITHHNEITELSDLMNAAFSEYMSSASEPVRAGTSSGN